MVSSASADNPMPDFALQLNSWVRSQLLEAALIAPEESFDWRVISGDAGFRRYFRLRLSSVNLLAVYAPPSSENNRGFLSIAEFLLSHGVHVPKILFYDLNLGFFLIEDLGETLYLDHLNEESANILYGEALFTLLRIQQCPLDYGVFPPYSRQRLLEEMQLFGQWFVAQLLDYTVQDEDAQVLRRAFDILLDSAVAQPQTVVHRDYHSRNIVFGVGGSPGIIDFQDAVVGPLTYDLVSLLRDCYIEWPLPQVEAWALAYASLACDAGVMPEVSEQEFLRWFDLMGVQRHIKVLGIFARLSLRDGKHAYLKDLPLVVNYVRSVVARYPELTEFSQWFESQMMPRIQSASWATPALAARR